jgi:hypothetical protein
LFAGAVVALSLIACSGPRESESGTGREHTLVQGPDYTGVIFSEKGALEFGYLLDETSAGFWEPSIDDISSAEACIRKHLVSLQLNPKLDAHQKENVAFILSNLADYRRQYVGIVVDGEKRIWCNSFLSDDSFPEWQRVPVDVDGGGRNFWQVEYLALKDRCTNFRVHGES